MDKFLVAYEVCGVLVEEIGRVCREHRGLPGEWLGSTARAWSLQINGMVDGIYFSQRQN